MATMTELHRLGPRTMLYSSVQMKVETYLGLQLEVILHKHDIAAAQDLTEGNVVKEVALEQFLSTGTHIMVAFQHTDGSCNAMKRYP